MIACMPPYRCYLRHPGFDLRSHTVTFTRTLHLLCKTGTCSNQGKGYIKQVLLEARVMKAVKHTGYPVEHSNSMLLLWLVTIIHFCLLTSTQTSKSTVQEASAVTFSRSKGSYNQGNTCPAAKRAS